MNPFRTTADMPGFVDRTGPTLPTTRSSIPADEQPPDAVRPSESWWQRWRWKILAAIGRG